jgi:hypothetical protein
MLNCIPANDEIWDYCDVHVYEVMPGKSHIRSAFEVLDVASDPYCGTMSYPIYEVELNPSISVCPIHICSTTTPAIFLDFERAHNLLG